MTTQSSAAQSSTPLDSTSSNFDQATPQDQQAETQSDDGLHKVETAREKIAKSEVAAEISTASTMSSNPTSTSNVALTNDSDWALLLTALIAKESTSLDSEGYLKLCKSSASPFSPFLTLHSRAYR
ncbi:hypothetical protein JCM5353_008869 [Sporobolomyces roseus]